MTYLIKKIFRFVVLCSICVIVIGCGSSEKISTDMPIIFMDHNNSTEITTINDLIEREADTNNTAKGKTRVLDKEIEKKTNVEVKSGVNSGTNTITCKIEAPDIYSYLKTHEAELMELNDELLLDTILREIESTDFPRKNVTLNLPVTIVDEKIIVDTSSFEYQDAVTGGLYTYLGELYEKALTELGDE